MVDVLSFTDRGLRHIEIKVIDTRPQLVPGIKQSFADAPIARVGAVVSPLFPVDDYSILL